MVTHVLAIITKKVAWYLCQILNSYESKQTKLKKVSPLIQILLNYIFSRGFPLYNQVSVVPRKGLHSRAVYDTHMALWYLDCACMHCLGKSLDHAFINT